MTYKPMKSLIFRFLIVFLALTPLQWLNAQEDSAKTNAYGEPSTYRESCYRKWYKAFKIRGSKEIENGVHEDVIVSLSRGMDGDCFYGKVEIRGGSVREIFIKTTEGDYEQVHFEEEEDILIDNGISDPVISNLRSQRQVVHVIFPSALRPKAAAYEQAPEPDIDF